MNVGGIEYADAGAGEPVICLHGIGGGSGSFAHQMTGLGDRHVIAWNMPGYGGAVAPQKRPISAAEII